MMFTKFEDSKELLEMLCLISTGLDTVSKIQEKTKMKQSTTSNRLMILRESDILYNKRWKYFVNWDKLCKIFRETVKEQIKADLTVKSIKTKKKPKDIENYFSDGLIQSIVIGFGYLLLNDYRKMSLRELVDSYLDWLSVVDDKKLDEVDKEYRDDLRKIKEMIEYRISTNEFLFCVLSSKGIKKRLKR